LTGVLSGPMRIPGFVNAIALHRRVPHTPADKGV